MFVARLNVSEFPGNICKANIVRVGRIHTCRLIIAPLQGIPAAHSCGGVVVLSLCRADVIR